MALEKLEGRDNTSQEVQNTIKEFDRYVPISAREGKELETKTSKAMYEILKRSLN